MSDDKKVTKVKVDKLKEVKKPDKKPAPKKVAKKKVEKDDLELRVTQLEDFVSRLVNKGDFCRNCLNYQKNGYCTSKNKIVSPLSGCGEFGR